MTVEEFLEQEYYPDSLSGGTLHYVMIEFAKLHVEAALKEASRQAELDYEEGSCRECGSNKIDEKSILNAYPLENIK